MTRDPQGRGLPMSASGQEVGSCHLKSSATVWQELSPLPARPSHFRVCIVSHILIIHEKASQSIPSMIPL